jgi:hypothetical protein
MCREVPIFYGRRRPCITGRSFFFCGNLGQAGPKESDVAATKVGRVESGLSQDLMDRPDIGQAARAQLRSQARAVDVAEAARDVELVTKANAVYLTSLAANGLVVGSPPVTDSFAEFLSELSKPAADMGDVPNH